MAFNKETGVVTDKTGKEIAIKEGDNVRMLDGSKVPPWINMQIGKAEKPKKPKPAKKAVSVAKPEETSTSNSGPTETINVDVSDLPKGDFPIINPDAKAHDIKSPDRVPNTGYVYKEQATGLVINEQTLQAAINKLTLHRMHKNKPKETFAPGICRKDILGYTAQRCSPDFLTK